MVSEAIEADAAISNVVKNGYNLPFTRIPTPLGYSSANSA